MNSRMFTHMVLVLGVFLILSVPSFTEEKSSKSNAHEKHEHEGHIPPHGGILHEIEGCAVGHAEVKIIDGNIEIWLLDGGNETNRSIPISDERIPLSILSPQNERIELTLISDPMRLAGEKAGKSSHFIGKSDALKKLPAFEGYAWVRFKGTMRALRISHPKGFEGDVEQENGNKPSDHEEKK